MKKQEILRALHIIEDQELIDNFNERLGVNTDDFLFLNRALFEDIESDNIFM